MPKEALNVHSRLVDSVGRTLEEQILSGELRPGDRLTVVPLAHRFGMSQSTIREALLMLEQRGLVTSKPRRGVFVSRLDEREAADICRMRALIEAYALSVGAVRITNDLLAALERQVAGMRKCSLPRNLSKLIQHDQEFHRLIAELADSPTLIRVWSTMNGRIGALIMRSVEANQLEPTDTVRYHTLVVEALATRDPALCRTAIIDHYLPEDGARGEQLESISAAVASLQP